MQQVESGDAGELLLSGSQVTSGYWQDPEKTAEAFIKPPGRSTIFYRTGDKVRSPINGGPIKFLGRIDNQIKLHGYRIELGEIEAALRKVAKVDQAVAVGWPQSPAGPQGIVGFLDETSSSAEQVRSGLRGLLPSYMVPSELHFLSEFPLNTNGKIDRNALTKSLEETPNDAQT